MKKGVVALLSACMLAGCSQASEPILPEKEVFNAMVREYLLENPEILQEMLEKLQAEQRDAQEERLTEAIFAEKDAIFYPNGSVVLGNPRGAVTLVEFFDYQCGRCVQVHPEFTQLLADNDDLRIVLKQFPIFGDLSIYMAKATLAAQKQGMGAEMHEGLIAMIRDRTEASSEEDVNRVARSIGVNMREFEEDLASEEVLGVLKENHRLAQKLEVRGTPFLIIADSALKDREGLFVVPGALPAETLQQMIDRAR